MLGKSPALNLAPGPPSWECQDCQGFLCFLIVFDEYNLKINWNFNLDVQEKGLCVQCVKKWLTTWFLHVLNYTYMDIWHNITCEGGERKPARVFSVKPARKMISNIDYPIISHLSNMPTFFWAKTRQIRGADTPRGRNVPGKEAGQRQTKWHTVWCAISICHTWPRR